MTNVDNFLTIFGDGGSRGNPGESAYGFAVYDTNENLIYKEGKKLGIQTNNYAEYQAVINALVWVINNKPDISIIKFKLDSLLVASQMNGSFKVKHPEIKKLFLKAKELEGNLNGKITYSQIPRALNKVADKMVNDALDDLI